MKQRAAVLTVLVAAMVLVACGGDDGSGGSAGGGGGKRDYDIALVTGVRGDAFYTSLQCGAETAAKKAGATLDTQSPEQFDPGSQIPVLNAVISKQPDAILIAATDPRALQAPLAQAAADGIEIVLVDTTTDDPSFAAAQVTSDNEGAGRQAAEQLAKQVGEKGSVLTIDVNPGITTTEARVKGFRAGLKAFPGLKDLGVQYTRDDPAKASSITTSTLARDPELAGIFATNTLTGEGAATGLRQQGEQGDVKLIGFDANPSGIEALRDGHAQIQVVLKPLDIGRIGVEQAIAALDGKASKKKILTGSLVATKDNLDSPEIERYRYKDTCAG